MANLSLAARFSLGGRVILITGKQHHFLKTPNEL
jgi:hypothetical protein